MFDHLARPVFMNVQDILEFSPLHCIGPTKYDTVVYKQKMANATTPSRHS